MSIKWKDEPLLNKAESVDLLGYDCRVLPDGRIFINEWVEEEEDGVVQVHDDQGRDYIVAGNPTLGMLYRDAETFIRIEGETLLERIQQNLESEVPEAKPGKEK